MAPSDSAFSDPIRVNGPVRHALVELHAVGGVNAGRVWALGMGTHTLGPAADSAVLLRGGPGSAHGVRLTVTPDGAAWLALPSLLDGADAPQPVPGGPVLRTIRPKDSVGTAWEPVVGQEFRWPEGAQFSICGSTLSLARPSSPAPPERASASESVSESEVARIERAMLYERAVRCAEAPDPATLALDLIGGGVFAGSRKPEEQSRLWLRVGAAEGPSHAEATVRDPGSEDAGRLAGHWILPGLPSGLNLADCGVLGVSSGLGTARALARWLVIQAATYCGPENLSIRVFADPSAGRSWDWAARLPHLAAQRGTDEADSYSAADPQRVGRSIGELAAQIESRSSSRRPEILAVFDRASMLRRVEGVVGILSKGPEHGVYSICVDGALDALVPECRGMVHCSGDELTLTAPRDHEAERRGITPDLVSPEWCERVAVTVSAYSSAA